MSLALLCAATVQAGEVRVERTGYALQAEQTGEGATVVVFESGFGQGAGVWKDVIADLGTACRCVAYARASAGNPSAGSCARAAQVDGSPSYRRFRGLRRGRRSVSQRQQPAGERQHNCRGWQRRELRCGHS